MERVYTLSMHPDYLLLKEGELLMAKFSRYNHFQKWRDGYYIAYNAWSGAVALVTTEQYRFIENLKDKLASGETLSLTGEEQELYKQLEYASFIHPDYYDHYDEARFQHHLTRYDLANPGFVIAPTMACNMACKYCFESNKRGRMSEETIRAFCGHIEKNAHRISSLSITWYGGEPLLGIDIIEKITDSVAELQKEYRFKYTSVAISNGYLLTPDNVDRILKLGVTGVQVTIDGPARIHNEKRPLKNGEPSYQRILDNVRYAQEKMNVSIRVNIDRDFNIDMLSEMLDELSAAGLKEKADIYFGFLEPATTVCANIAENCHSSEDFSRAETEYFRLLLKEGFIINKLPHPMTNFCLAQTAGGFVMDHEGELYKCFNYVGDKERSMGNIRDDINYNHPEFTKMFAFDPYADETCRDCNILPICLGGCPSRRLHRNAARDEMCESWKHNLPEMLEIIAMSRYRRLETVAKE